jgi:hypothetical protein
MQRVIPFGRGYAESAEFSVDEGQTIRFWLVREDYTTTIGEAEVELQVKSAVGNDHWTTLVFMNDEQPYYDLVGTDEELVYQWVRKAGQPSVAVDRSSDTAMSRVQATQPAFVPANTLTESDPALCARVKLIFAQDPGDPDVVGAKVTFPSGDPTDFGALTSGALGALLDPDLAGTFQYTYDEGTGDTTFAITGTLVDLAGFVVKVLNPDGSVADSYTITAGDTPSATSLSAVVPGLDAIADDTSLWLTVCPSAVAYEPGPTIANSGTFTLDQNDIPARLTATGFDPDAPFEQVVLYAVDGGEAIPLTYNEDGDPIRLVRSFRGYTIVAPGEYEWRRTDYSNISVFLNTGWRA